MLHFEQTIHCPSDCFAVFGIPAEQVLFFDIETTGFSPESSYVYLIGCAFVNNGAVKLRQWFLDDISEEKQLVREFGIFSENFRMLVHYNGSTFDLPYLQKKARRHRLFGTYFCAVAATDSCNPAADDGIPQKERTRQQSFDIYKSLLPCKKLLGLKDLKQKTVEQFLGIPRKDTFSGGDLIPVYTEFLGRYRYECITRGNPFQKTKMAEDIAEDTADGMQTDAPPCTEKSGQNAPFSPTDTSSRSTPDFDDTGLTKMPESPAKALLYVLLLHNREDISGLLGISALLCLPKLLGGAFTVTELSGGFTAAEPSGESAATELFGKFTATEPSGELSVTELFGKFSTTEFSGKYPNMNVKCDQTAPPSSYRIFRLDTGLDAALLSSCFRAETVKQLPEGAPTAGDSPAAVSLSIADTPGSLLLFVPVLSGTFKYFFEDYKEYYYLPLEDCAMHKSIAQFVAKEYRKRATKETCYQKKEGLFLPQPEEIITPAFRLHAKDRFSYFENGKDALAEPTALKNWVCALLAWLFEKT